MSPGTPSVLNGLTLPALLAPKELLSTPREFARKLATTAIPGTNLTVLASLAMLVTTLQMEPVCSLTPITLFPLTQDARLGKMASAKNAATTGPSTLMESAFQ